MVRWLVMVSLWLVPFAATAQPRCALLQRDGVAAFAVLDGAYLRLRTADGQKALPDVAAPGITTISPGRDGQLYGARAERVLRLTGSQWVEAAVCEAPVQQVLAAPVDSSSSVVLLTGHPAEPVLADGRVWRLPLRHDAKPVRLEAIPDSYRPWRLWPSRVAGEERLAVGTWKATRFFPKEHRCHFVFGWRQDQIVPVWLGSRLSRPYLDATHADLAGDSSWRMVGLEESATGPPTLSVYAAIGFGYEFEWHSAPLDGATRVLTVAREALVWGPGRCWLLRRDGKAYALHSLRPVPPDPERVLAWKDRLWSWQEGGWHELSVVEDP